MKWACVVVLCCASVAHGQAFTFKGNYTIRVQDGPFSVSIPDDYQVYVWYSEPTLELSRSKNEVMVTATTPGTFRLTLEAYSVTEGEITDTFLHSVILEYGEPEKVLTKIPDDPPAREPPQQPPPQIPVDTGPDTSDLRRAVSDAVNAMPTAVKKQRFAIGRHYWVWATALREGQFRGSLNTQVNSALAKIDQANQTTLRGQNTIHWRTLLGRRQTSEVPATPGIIDRELRRLVENGEIRNKSDFADALVAISEAFSE